MSKKENYDLMGESLFDNESRIMFNDVENVEEKVWEIESLITYALEQITNKKQNIQLSKTHLTSIIRSTNTKL